jgi:hypothetical protein
VDKRRVRRVFGQVDASELKAIDEGLVLLLGLGHRLTPGEQTAGVGELG